MTRASGNKKDAAALSKSQTGSLDNFFGKAAASTSTSASKGLRPATARPRKEKGRPPERTSPRLARKRDSGAATTTIKPKELKKVAYVSLPPSRSTTASRKASPSPHKDPDALPPPPLLRPHFNSSASALSELSSLHDYESSELDPLTTEDERAPSPIPDSPTLTRGTARKRKVADLPVTPTPTKKRTSRRL